jgi:hypothetical protein
MHIWIIKEKWKKKKEFTYVQKKPVWSKGNKNGKMYRGHRFHEVEGLKLEWGN